MTIPHILLVSDRFPPSTGGLQAAGAELAVQFARLGFRVSVATMIPGAKSCVDYKVFHLESRDFREDALRLAQKLHPDIIVLNGLLHHLLYPISISRVPCPVIYRSHGIGANFHFFWEYPPFFGVGTWLGIIARAIRNAWIGRHLAREVFLDDKVGFFKSFDVVLSKLIHPKNISFIPNAFDSVARSDDNSFRAKYHINPEKLLVLNVANFSGLKGQLDAIKIIRKNPHMDAQFVFIGSEKNETHQKASVLAHGDSRICLLAGISREDVVDAINAADIAFLFSRQEQQPLFLSEAMSCGKPWISTNVGSVSKMRGGIVLRHRNARCFVQAMRELEVPERRTGLGSEGKSFWETHYSPEVVYSQWRKLLNDVMSETMTSMYRHGSFLCTDEQQVF